MFPRAVGSEWLHQMGVYDAVVEVWNGVPWMTPVWCRKPHITFLHHVHGPMWDQLLPRSLAGLGRALEARLAPPFYRRTLTLTPSEATRDDLLGLGFHPDRLIAVNNGVDQQFKPGGQRSAAPLVVCVGRLAPVKRQQEMIEAAVIARRRVPDLQLMIVGDGPLCPALEARIAAHGAGGWITLVGRLTHAELVAIYQQAWLVSSASLAEGWGLTMTEAAACGTTAVATDVSGHRSSIVDGVTGVLAPLERLGDTIADVLLDHDRREPNGDGGAGPCADADVGCVGAGDSRRAARPGAPSRRGACRDERRSSPQNRLTIRPGWDAPGDRVDGEPVRPAGVDAPGDRADASRSGRPSGPRGPSRCEPVRPDRACRGTEPMRASQARPSVPQDRADAGRSRRLSGPRATPMSAGHVG